MTLERSATINLSATTCPGLVFWSLSILY